jgi:membrane associated rhomboid family serine protease
MSNRIHVLNYELPQYVNNVIINNNKICGFFHSDFEVKQKIPYLSLFISLLLILLHILASYYYNFNIITGSYSRQNLLDIEITLVYPDIIDSYKLWQFVSHAFIHNDFLHILVNVMIFSIFSIYLESLYTWKPILLVLLGSIVSSALFQVVFYKDRIVLLGISGGVWGLCSTFFTNHIILTNYLISKVCLLCGLLIILVDYLYLNDIAVEAHLMGFIYGISVSIFITTGNMRRVNKFIYYICTINLHILCFVVCPMYIFMK